MKFYGTKKKGGGVEKVLAMLKRAQKRLKF